MQTVYMHEHFYTYYPRRKILNFRANQQSPFYNQHEWCDKEKRRKLTEPDGFYDGMRENDLFQTVYKKEICHEGSSMRDYPVDSWTGDLEKIRTYPLNKITEIENLSKFPSKCRPSKPSLDFYRLFGVQKVEDFVTPMTEYQGRIGYPAIVRQRRAILKNNDVM